jgi:hypothetical protein
VELAGLICIAMKTVRRPFVARSFFFLPNNVDVMHTNDLRRQAVVGHVRSRVAARPRGNLSFYFGE